MTGHARDGASGVGSLASWLAVFRRRWKTGGSILLVTVAASAALVLLARPIWRAEATARIGAVPGVGGISAAQGASTAGLFSLFQQMTGDPFSNELELLSSRTVVEGVVRDNALDARLIAPRGWPRDSLLTHISSTGVEDAATYLVSRDGANQVAVRRTEPSDSVLGEYLTGDTIALGGLRVVFAPLPAAAPSSFHLKTIPFGEAVRQTASELVTQRKRREANLVRISFASTDPGLALRVVESATKRYTELRAELQRRESGQTSDSLRTLTEQMLAQLLREEAALESFQRDAGLVAPEAQASAFVERQSEVLGTLETARVEMARTDEVLRRLAEARDPASAWVGLVAHPTFLANPTLGDLLASLIGLERERIALLGRRTPEDGGVRAIEQQIALLDASLRSLLRQYRDGVADGVRLLEGQKAQLDAALAQVPAGAIELRQRERAVRQLSEVYLFTDQRLRQEALRNAISFASVQVIDPPALQYKPIWPRRKLGLGIGLLLGLTFGALGMLVSERADRTVRDPRDAADLLNLPLLRRRSVAEASAVRETISSITARALVTGATSRVVLAPADRPTHERLVGLFGRNFPGSVTSNGESARPSSASGKQDTEGPRGAAANGAIYRGPARNDQATASPLKHLAGDAAAEVVATAAPKRGPASEAQPDSSADVAPPSIHLRGLSEAVGPISGYGRNGEGERPPRDPLELVVSPPVDSFPAALTMVDEAAESARIVLVVQAGRTLRADALLAAETLAEAGCRPLGLLVITAPAAGARGRA